MIHTSCENWSYVLWIKVALVPKIGFPLSHDFLLENQHYLELPQSQIQPIYLFSFYLKEVHRLTHCNLLLQNSAMAFRSCGQTAYTSAKVLYSLCRLIPFYTSKSMHALVAVYGLTLPSATATCFGCVLVIFQRFCTFKS